MGKNTAKRRAAKAKTQQRSRIANGPAPRPPQPSPPWEPFAEKASRTAPPPPRDEPQGLADPDVDAVLVQLAQAWRGHPHIPIQLERHLDGLEGPKLAQFQRRAEVLLLRLVDSLWQYGWQPAELSRQGRLGCNSGAGGRLVASAIAVDHANRRANTLDHRWRAQVDSLSLPPVSGRPGWLRGWATTEGLMARVQLSAIVDALSNLLHLPRIDVILPPPGSPVPSQAACPANARPASGAPANPMLARIRALLAKAESTTFEAEAEALIAKAQELMTRHAIDAAMVHARSGGTAEAPEAIRVPIDAPYAYGKSLLLQFVAEASRCRAVWMSDVAMSEVVGLQGDLAAVEVLFTSLLVQAQAALADTARRSPSGSRARSTSFRSSFLLAFTHRIRERLTEANDTVLAQAEAELGSTFLPVLRSQSEALDAAVAERLGKVTRSAVRPARDGAGWDSGRQAADRARLDSGDLGAPRSIDR